MLSDQEKLTIKVALARARREGREDEEIHKLANGFGKMAAEVRAYWLEIAGDAAAPSQKEPAGRHTWTTGEIEQLYHLRTDGKGPTEIAKIMGMTAAQVNSRLRDEKKRHRPERPCKLAGDDHLAAPPGPPPGPEPETGEPESPSLPEKPSAISKDDPDSFSFEAAAIAKRPFLFAVELTGLMKNLEYSHPPVEMGYLEANQTAGWATCHFKAAGEDYIISLRREEQKA